MSDLPAATGRVLCIEHFGEWWNAQKEAAE